MGCVGLCDGGGGGIDPWFSFSVDVKLCGSFLFSFAVG